MFVRTGRYWFDSDVSAIHDSILRHGGTPAFEGLLPSLVEQVYRTRADFRDEMAALMTIIIAIFTAGGFLLHQGIEQWGDAPAKHTCLLLLAMAVFAAIHPLGSLYRNRLSAAYDIYVAACIHCVMYYNAYNLPLTHQWQRNVIECLTQARGNFTGRRDASTSHDSWQWHREFTPAANGNHPTEYGELVQAWKERRPNLSTSLRQTIRVAKWVGTIFALICLTLIIATRVLPEKYFVNESNEQGGSRLVNADRMVSPHSN